MAQSKRIKIVIYVEGGGDSQSRQTPQRCRDGFREYFRKLGLDERLLKVLPCGSRNEAIKTFCDAASDPPSGELPLLLVDSEHAVARADRNRPQGYIFGSGKKLPRGVTTKQLHLLVRCLETVLVADPAAVEKILGGKGFRRGKLPKHADLEQVSPEDLERGLIDASRRVKDKKYAKGRHSFAILANVDPEKAAQASPWVKRLHDTLRKAC